MHILRNIFSIAIAKYQPVMKIHWVYWAILKSRAARQWSLLWNTCPAFKQVKTSNLVQFTVYCDWFDEILYLIRIKRTLNPLISGSVVFLKDLAAIFPDQCSKPPGYGFRLLLAQIFLLSISCHTSFLILNTKLIGKNIHSLASLNLKLVWREIDKMKIFARRRWNPFTWGSLH